ncbi:hypothetical protein ACV07N_13520 [Roseivirga echinicomitans]
MVSTILGYFMIKRSKRRNEIQWLVGENINNGETQNSRKVAIITTLFTEER